MMHQESIEINIIPAIKNYEAGAGKIVQRLTLPTIKPVDLSLIPGTTW